VYSEYRTRQKCQFCNKHLYRKTSCATLDVAKRYPWKRVRQHSHRANKHRTPCTSTHCTAAESGTKSKPNTYENKMFRGYLDIRGNEKQCSRISHEEFRNIHHHHHTLSRRSARRSIQQAWDKRLEQYLIGKNSKKQLENLIELGKDG